MKKNSFLAKWVLPFSITIAIAGWVLYDDVAKAEPEYGVAAVVLLAILGVLYFVVRQRGLTLPDEVLDGGEFLQLTFNGEIERLPLSSVAEVRYEKIVRLHRITLLLREPLGRRGRVITFYPLQRVDASGQNVVAASLLARVRPAARLRS